MRSRSRLVVRFALAVACCALGTAAVAPPAGADQQLCDPANGGDQFCVTFAATQPDTLLAADPFALGFTFSNTSQSVTTSENAWIDHVQLQTLAAPNAPVKVTPSADLPDDLLLAGGDADCPPPVNPTHDFTLCDAGHGTTEANVFPFGIGFTNGTVGVSKVVNVQDDGDAATDISWVVSFTTCTNVFGSPCGQALTRDVAVTGTISPAGAATLSFPTYEQVLNGQDPLADVSFTALTIALQAQSSTLDGGAPAGGTFTVASLPTRCAALAGTAELVSHGNVGGNPSPSTLDFPLQGQVTGCPTASLALGAVHFGATGPSVDLNGGGSTATNGRTVSQYKWTFGDGKKQTTTDSSTTHRYAASPATAKDYLAKLVVVDSAGAVSSASAPVTLHGTVVTIGAPVQTSVSLTIRGAVVPNEQPGAVSVTLRRKVSGTFHAIGTRPGTLGASGKFQSTFSRPAAGSCQAIVKYAGRPADAVLGSIGTSTFPC